MILENKTLGSQQQAIKVADLKETADFYRSRLAEIKKKQWDINQTIQKLQKQIATLSSQLTSLRSQKEQPTSEILVTVSTKTASTVPFTITYLVNDAGWLPSYDVRVKDITSPIAMIYKANVSQSSGEDWQHVKLTISTGNPSQGGTRPVLNPWHLGYNTVYVKSLSTVSGRVTDSNGESLPGATVLVKGTTIGTVTDQHGQYTLQLPANATLLQVNYIGYQAKEIPLTAANVDIALAEDMSALDEVVVVGYGTTARADDTKLGYYNKRKKETQTIKPLVAVQQVRQTNVEFRIEIPYSIPTDGKQYAVDMQEYAIPAYYEYYCAPKLDTDVFLTAKLADWDAYNLLDGEMNLFFEGTYLGKSLLDVQNTGDTLTLSLGRDKNIVVTRTKGKDVSSKQLLGVHKKDTRSWEIVVRNKKQQPINLVLEDQVPMSTTKEIEIELLEKSGAVLETNTGKLTWTFQLPAAQSKTIQLKYSARYPKDQRVILE